MRTKKNETVTFNKGCNLAHLDYVQLKKAGVVLSAVNHKLGQRITDLLKSWLDYFSHLYFQKTKI